MKHFDSTDDLAYLALFAEIDDEAAVIATFKELEEESVERPHAISSTTKGYR